jgi:cation diffusion facilitator family transporter
MVENAVQARRAGRSVTLTGFWINVLLILVKFLAGWFGRSQALIADAVHSVSDLLTDGVTLLGIHVGRQEADERHPFGHARLETLASAVVGVSLIGTGVYLGVDAGIGIHGHREQAPTLLALVGAGLSIACKEFLYQYTVRIGKRIQSRLIEVNAWHHRSDALSSVAVFLGVLGATIHPGWRILDAYAALLVSFFVVKVGLDALRDSLREFTDTAPAPEVVDQIRRCISATDGVMDVHDIRVRTAGGRYQMEAHVEVRDRLTVGEGHRIAKSVESCLLEEIGDMDRVIIHVDPWAPPPDVSARGTNHDRGKRPKPSTEG